VVPTAESEGPRQPLTPELSVRVRAALDEVLATDSIRVDAQTVAVAMANAPTPAEVLDSFATDVLGGVYEAAGDEQTDAESVGWESTVGDGVD